MESNELMAGDWVSTQRYIQGYPCVDVNVRVDAFMLERLDMGTDMAEPVILLPRSLKKNGFKEGYNEWHKEQKNEDAPYPYEIHLEDEGHFYYLEIKTFDAFLQTKICDVHELQHALRLCGLNELADNFKV